MVKRPEGWNKELYDKLSFEYLIECAKNHRIDEWNCVYEEYLRSEWKRIFPNKEYDPERISFMINTYHHNVNSFFVYPNFTGRDFIPAIGGGADFSHACLCGANFWSVNLEHADFTDANLICTLFGETSLDNAIFAKARMNYAVFREANGNNTYFGDANLHGADFHMANLYNPHFFQTDMEGADFSWATIKSACFLFTNLEGVDFSHTCLEQANFMFAGLMGLDFSGANLSDADFSSAHLQGANLSNTHLEGADFTNSHIEGTQFTLAVVNGKTLFSDNTIDDKTDFTGTNLSVVRIDPKLRKHLERNIRKLNITNKNVFVAMKFDCPDLDSALKNAIKPAFLECGGMEAFTVNEKAGNEWIPLMIKEGIQNARFVISDLTYRNPGVYYETGYADGLDIPVIQTCNKLWYDKDPAPLHFDIAQRNTIFWNDNEDLKQQLIQKIKELQENGK
jgi:uncharacterized protein YjbI with pentapeptide repeats